MGRPKKYFTDEERREARREASRRFYRTDKGKANEARRDQEKAKAAYARYRETEGYAAAQERRRLKDMANGWPTQTARRMEIRINNPNQYGAWVAVGVAERTGVLVRPATCQSCGAERKLHAHHHLGYARDHWLDVQWLCVPCHKKAHRGHLAA